MVVEVSGVGFRVTVSLQTLHELPEVGQAAKLLTYLQVREDALVLFGFATESERTAFELCTSVQGIGPKIAISILSSLSPAELATAIKAEDVPRLKRVPGVGMKTAERLVLELRDKLDKAGLVSRAASEKAPPSRPAAQRALQISSALTNLGYRSGEAERAAEAVALEAPDNLPVAELVKRALRALAE